MFNVGTVYRCVHVYPQGFGLEYDRYLKEVVMALEEDSAFREKLEQMNISDIKVCVGPSTLTLRETNIVIC